ncbi:hypothetical protein NQ317_001969 [Molorchus minor]|uniref:Transposase n=1 Tax=Molorchus minor TaxID=1323400 RepID=A0ABQ9J7X8_9CUCU|nr:hypothetical protein NQ317_001969 [Molorchus minor]
MQSVFFCDGKFFEDIRGELWVQCIMCEMWAHCDCADCEKDDYRKTKKIGEVCKISVKAWKGATPLNSRSESIPQEIEESATRSTLDLLPTKSKKQYELAYNRSVEWCDRNNVAGKYSENVILSYFEQSSKIWKSSMLWAHFFNDKGYVKCREQSRYKGARLFEVLKYLFKVVAVMGILGVCRREKLCQISLNNIEGFRKYTSDSKTRFSRTFTVITETYIDLYRKYLALRPSHVNHQRLFIKYTR